GRTSYRRKGNDPIGRNTPSRGGRPTPGEREGGRHARALHPPGRHQPVRRALPSANDLPFRGAPAGGRDHHPWDQGRGKRQASGPAEEGMRRRMRTRLEYAVLAGAAADLAGLGLIAAASWLITRAAEQPPLAALSVAIMATRAFATGRGVFRYAERLTGHDVAL